MLKLLLCLASAMVVAVLILQLRQQHIELDHQANQLHDQIEAQQGKLWNQQLQIAIMTAPNAIAQTVQTRSLKMVPRSARSANWTLQATTDNDPATP